MSVMSSAWRTSLAAAALWALLGPAPAATAQDKPAEKEKPKAAAERPDADKPAVREREGDRERPAAREREGDRPRPAAREREGDRERPGARERDGDRPHRGEGDPRMREVFEKRRHIMEQIGQIKGQLERIDNKESEDARELRSKLEQLHEQLRGLPGPQPPRMDPEKAKRLEQIKERYQQLMQEGKRDEAEALKREAQELMQSMPREREGGPPPADMERRTHHLKAAIENLRAAGMHEAADRLQEMGHRLPPGGRPERPEGPPHAGPGVQDLRGEVQQMRREMQELREQLRRLLEREHKDR